MQGIYKHYIIDMSCNNNFVQIPTVQGDGNNVRGFEVELIANNVQYVVDVTNTYVCIAGTKPDTKQILNDCQITADGYILVDITQQMAAVAGRGDYSIVLMDKNTNAQLKSFPFYILTTPSAYSATDIVSSNEFQTLTKGITEINKIKDEITDFKNTLETNESDRVTAEQQRINNENIRKENENKRKTAETDRINSENERKDAERSRELQETQRNNAEQIRITNENKRIEDENARKQAEIDRQTAEQQRQNTFENAINDVTLATDNANSAALLANTEATNANRATERANNISTDLENKVASGYFNGKDGKDGIDGKDGVITTLKGQIAFDIEDGNLMVYYSDDENLPDAHIDENGCLVLTIE